MIIPMQPISGKGKSSCRLVLHSDNKCLLLPEWEGCNLLHRKLKKKKKKRANTPSFSLSAAGIQMFFYALIFLYTPRKSRDFVSERLHGQTHLKERIAKRFGSLWIRQASHFSGKLSNSFKRAVSDTILFDTLCPLLESHKGLCRETVYREQLIFLPHTSDN